MMLERWYQFEEVVRLVEARRLCRVKRSRFTPEAAKLRRKAFKENGRRK